MPPRTERQRRYHDKPLSIEFLGDARRDPAVFHDVRGLKDTQLIADELREFAELGGRTVVEVTSKGLSPDPRAVKEIADATGVNVIMGCGHYLAPSHPPEVATRDADELAAELIDEIENGLQGSGIRPGVIGEVGTGHPVEAEEWKTLEAACIAQRETGLCLFVHVDPTGRSIVDVVERVLGHGVAPERLNVCHLDGVPDLDYLKQIADYGVWVSFDTFGMEVYYDSYDYAYNAHDTQWVDSLVAMVEAGYIGQLVLGQDICMKLQLQRFGGYGYAHLLRHIVPNLRFRGVDAAALDQMLLENPKRILGRQEAAAR
jgi:phosphotriesterase-related protein